jgi:two-component system cell cycle response regulator CtrA
MFFNHLYGGMDEPELKIIDVFICKLRKKLRAATDHHHIETVWARLRRTSYEMSPFLLW